MIVAKDKAVTLDYTLSDERGETSRHPRERNPLPISMEAAV